MKTIILRCDDGLLFCVRNEVNMLDFLSRSKKRRQQPIVKPFIGPAKAKIPYSTTDPELRDVYRLTPHNPIDASILERAGITSSDLKFYKFTAGIANNFLSALFAVPAARAYYGDDFLHGLRCSVASGSKVVYINMDNTKAATALTKEITKYCAIVLDPWLTKYKYYLRWDPISIQTVPEPIDPRYCVDLDYRITWYEVWEQK